MDNTNNIMLNMLKGKLIEVYQTYSDSPELLDNKRVRKCYESLQSVRTLSEFKQWQYLIDAYGLSFTNVDDVEVSNNVLGVLDDISHNVDEAVLLEFIKWKTTFTFDKWKEVCKSNEEAVAWIQKETERKYDVHILLFRCNGALAAIGEDANRIFKLFGWQTGYVSNGKENVSFMYISKYGQAVLEASKYSIKIADCVPVDIISFAFNEDMIATYQQLLDCARIVWKEGHVHKQAMKYCLKVFQSEQGYQLLANARVTIDCDNEVNIELDNGNEVILTQGNQSQLDKLSLHLLQSLGKKIGEA